MRGGPADGLIVAITRKQLHRPLLAEGWPNAYHWHLDEDLDLFGKPIFRCDVPELIECNFVISPGAIRAASIDMVAHIEESVRQKLRNPGYTVHIRWDATNEAHVYTERIDPRTADLSRYTMLKCGGMVIRDRHDKEEPAA